MNTTNTSYNPAEDENQGILTKLAQGEEANSGVAQADYMSPVTNQGPEPEKEEVNDSDVEANGVNDDLLTEEEIEDGAIDVDTD
jgi:hypothetical protein